MNNKIYSQVTISIAIGSIVFAIITSAISFYKNYQLAFHRSEQQITELFFAIEQIASDALFSKNDELIQKILQGLTVSEFVSDAHIVESISALNKSPSQMTFNLYSPLNKKDRIGLISIIPNQKYIETYASQASKNQIIILMLYFILVILLSLLIINRILVDPIKRIIHTFHHINSGTQTRVNVPDRHKKNEIGFLAQDINALLDAAMSQIARERALRNETENLSKKFRLLFDKANVGIGLIDKKNQLIIANPTLLGLLTQSYIVHNDKFQPTEFTQHFQQPNQVNEFIENFRIKHGDQFCALDTKLRHKARNADKWVHCLLSKVEEIHSPEESLLEVVLYDITARSQREMNIIYDAEHDMLTGLYNRRASLPKLEASLEKAKDKQYHFAILMIDLDGFKKVNDTYGHDSGDKVITEVSRRVKQYFRGTDVVTRWGGDEFLIGFSFDPSYKTAVVDIVSDLQYQISLPISIGREQTTGVGSSIGISLYPLHGNSINSLIEKSDITMYQVKQQGKNGFAIYENARGACSVVAYSRSP